MDGNGRWAKARNRPRAFGHKEGVEALRRAVDGAKALGIEHLTVYSFSTENWNRPPAEIDALFGLFKLYVHKDLANLHKEGVRVRMYGSRDRLSQDLIDLIDECERKTRDNREFFFNIAFNYGGRAEVVEAARQLAEEVSSGALTPDQIDENLLQSRMWTGDLPDVDLMLRTSGEERISNFLLWGIAYSELLFLDVLWPDFDRSHLEQAIEVFKCRNRRFGGVA